MRLGPPSRVAVGQLPTREPITLTLALFFICRCQADTRHVSMSMSYLVFKEPAHERGPPARKPPISFFQILGEPSDAIEVGPVCQWELS